MKAVAVLGVAVLMVAPGLGCRPDPSSKQHEPVAAAVAVPPACTRDVGQVQTLAAGGVPVDPKRPVHTFSIVARDPVTGDLGAAVQSHWFAVGNGVLWVQPGVGAIASQSFAEPAYGRKGLERLAAGGAPADVLAALIADDKGAAVRQVAMIDSQGRVAVHTGSSCIAFAGDHAGTGYSVQANLMANDRVVPAMVAAYEHAQGDLAERLMVTLEAAQVAGGDVRGCQSAAIRVVRGTPSAEPSHDVLVDLRVDDAAAPLTELRRLLALQRVYDHMNAGDVAVERGDLAGARDHYGAAAGAAPHLTEVRYWQAVALANAGQLDDSLPIFRTVFAEDQRWVEVTRRLQPGVVPRTPAGDALIERIVHDAAPR